jgi:hypothetical protein
VAVRLFSSLTAVVALLALGACSDDAGDRATDVGTGIGPGATLPDELAAPTTSIPSGSDAPSPGGGQDPGGTPSNGCGLCLTVDAPLRCEGETVLATARWVDRGATRAGLLVDGGAVSGTVPPAGPFDLDLPCDGRAHTVVLVVALPGGGTEQSSFAVRSIPAR